MSLSVMKVLKLCDVKHKGGSTIIIDRFKAGKGGL